MAARDNNLFLSFARKARKWDEPTDPIKIVGPLNFVGTKGLSSWLFVTSEGHSAQHGNADFRAHDRRVHQEAGVQAEGH